MRNLLLDIETSPNTAYVWGLFKQNVGLPQIIETGRVLCLAYKWYGDPDTHFISEWDPGGRSLFLAKVRTILDLADVVTTYNGKKFDLPTLCKELVMADLPPPSPYKQIDLYQVVRSSFRFTSNKLDHVSEQLGLGRKVDTGGFQLWIDVMNGCPEAREKMKTYNLQDVDLMVPLYEKLRPWIRNHPNMALYSEPGQRFDQPVCRSCGHEALTKRGYAYTSLGKFQRYCCTECGTWSRGRTNLVDKEKRKHVTATITG